MLILTGCSDKGAKRPASCFWNPTQVICGGENTSATWIDPWYFGDRNRRH